MRVQPGMVHERLNAQLRLRGRLFGPDPANSAVTTVGSMIALDASGSRWLKYGSVRRHVRSLQVALADGQLLEFDRARWSAASARIPQPRKRDLVNRLAALLTEQADVIRRHQPKGPLSRCGYNLAGVLADGPSRPGGALGGLGRDPGLDHRGHAGHAAVAPASRRRAAAVREPGEGRRGPPARSCPPQPSACDLMDRRHLSVAREGEIRFDLLIPAETEALLLVEYEGDDPARGPRPRPPAGRRDLPAAAAGLRRPAGVRPGGNRPVLATGPQEPAAVVPREGAKPAGARGRGRRRAAGNALRVPGPHAERAEASPDHRLAALPRRPWATPHPAFSGPRRSGRRAADAAGGRGTLPGGVRRRRHDQRRTCLRPEPHALPRPPDRAALRRPPPGEADFRSRQRVEPGQDRRRRSRAADALFAACLGRAGGRRRSSRSKPIRRSSAT